MYVQGVSCTPGGNAMHRLTVGEVAKRAAVHIETLRYYERQGLVARPPRSRSNYRLYPEETVRRGGVFHRPPHARLLPLGRYGTPAPPGGAPRTARGGPGGGPPAN